MTIVILFYKVKSIIQKNILKIKSKNKKNQNKPKINGHRFKIIGNYKKTIVVLIN